MIRFIAISLLLCSSAFGQKDIDSLLQKFKSQTPLISVSRALEKINDPLIIFLDARETEEYTTSHVRGAIHIGYAQFTIDKVSTLPKHSELIVYCSIGYRSDVIAQKLKKAGFTSVSNLRGGIFTWSNEEYPLFNGKHEQTTMIHGYSKQWSEYIKKGTVIF